MTFDLFPWNKRLLIFFLLTGGVGISNIIKDIEEKEYMGFEDICSY